MFVVAYLFLGPATPGAWMAQTSDPSNPLAWLPALGPFAAAAAVGWVFTRDLREQRDHYRDKLEERQSHDAEIAATFRTAVQTIEANTAAMSATRDALTDNRDRLTAIEKRLLSIERQRR